MSKLHKLELVERDEYFTVNIVDGGVKLAFGKREAAVLTDDGVITRKSVRGFRIDEQQARNLLFLDWQYTDGEKEETLLGEITDLYQAKEWIKKVNELWVKK